MRTFLFGKAAMLAGTLAVCVVFLVEYYSINTEIKGMFESFFDFMSNLNNEIQQMKAEGYPEELIHDHIQDSRKDYNYRKSVSDAINRRESEARYYNGLDPDNPYDDL